MTSDTERNRSPRAAFSPVTVETKPSGDHHGGWLHQWLLGEYLAMLLMAHAIMTAVVWVCYVANPPLELIMVLASGWVAVRCAGGFSGNRYVSAVTVIVLGLTWATRWAEWGAVPSWLLTGPFSLTVLLAMLATVLVIDLLESWQSGEPRGDLFHKSVGTWSQKDD